MDDLHLKQALVAKTGMLVRKPKGTVEHHDRLNSIADRFLDPVSQ